MNTFERQMLLTALVATTLLLWGAHTHAADLQCGDTILPGEKVVLDSNVGPCTAATGPITVIGPATLDMNGYRISCLGGPDQPNGLIVAGAKAKIRNGTVLRCHVGIELFGEGRHRLVNVTVAASESYGIGVHSDRNVLKKVEAVANDGDGLTVRGERNTVKNCAAIENGSVGFAIRGARHRIIGNDALGNAIQGFAVYASAPGSLHKIIRNVGADNPLDFFAEDPSCSLNLWRKNLYGRANPECIR